jgi:SAM-dependent methyltransferase
MAERRHGYVVSVGYSANFFPTMAPVWLDFCMRAQGSVPARSGPSFRYLDLGCGPGFHLCLLAVANPDAEFVGIDFHAEHIASGQDLAAAAGIANVTFVQGDFLDLAAAWPAELGTYDYIALQGILSWVSEDVRAAAFKCVAHASKPGTIASFAYNSQPGSLKGVPFQHLASQLAKTRDDGAALEAAFTVFRRLRDAKAPVFSQLPRLERQLEVLALQPLSYLAHEFLTDHWTPLWHSEVARELRSGGFSYAGSATIAEALLPDALPPELRAILAEQRDETLYQDVQDVVIAQQFRRDIFCRSPARAEPAAELDGDAPIHLLSAPPEGAPVRFSTTFGALTVPYAAIADIVAALNDGPKAAAELMALTNPARSHTRSILLSMLEAEMLAIGAAEPGSADLAQRFNAEVARATAGGKLYLYVAAAALRSGVRVSELDLLLLDTWLSAGAGRDAQAIGQGLAERLKKLGRPVQFRGGTVSDEQLSSETAAIAARFIDQAVPKWRRLGVLA